MISKNSSMIWIWMTYSHHPFRKNHSDWQIWVAKVIWLRLSILYICPKFDNSWPKTLWSHNKASVKRVGRMVWNNVFAKGGQRPFGRMICFRSIDCPQEGQRTIWSSDRSEDCWSVTWVTWSVTSEDSDEFAWARISWFRNSMSCYLKPGLKSP